MIISLRKKTLWDLTKISGGGTSKEHSWEALETTQCKKKFGKWSKNSEFVPSMS